MFRQFRLLAACTLLAVLAIALTGTGQAADDPEEIAAAQKVTLKIADLIAAGKNDDAKKAVTDWVKKLDDYKDLRASMKAMALRGNGGYGFGPAVKPFAPDGIEAKLINLGRRPLPAKDLDAQFDALTKSAQIMAAISEMAIAKPPKKKLGKIDPEAWNTYAKEMKDATAEFSAAVKKKDPDAIKNAASRLNLNCTDCHNIFKKP